jgi:hypothetical protein
MQLDLLIRQDAFSRSVSPVEMVLRIVLMLYFSFGAAEDLTRF